MVFRLGPQEWRLCLVSLVALKPKQIKDKIHKPALGAQRRGGGMQAHTCEGPLRRALSRWFSSNEVNSEDPGARGLSVMPPPYPTLPLTSHVFGAINLTPLILCL